jgi:hypothetical protein
LTVSEQAAQVMPETDRVIVLATTNFFMTVPFSVEQWKNVSEGDGYPDQCRHAPENHFVSGSRLRLGADLAPLAGRNRAIDPAVGEDKSNARAADEGWAVWFERGQIADPGAAEPEGHQYQRTKATGRCED